MRDLRRTLAGLPIWRQGIIDDNDLKRVKGGMRVVQAHNYYQQPGGEDSVVAAEHSMLFDAGHEIYQFNVSNNEIVGPWKVLKTALQAPYSPVAGAKMSAILLEFQPDLVHVHNFFPLLTPAIYDACRTLDVPVIQTLHNYRIVCAGALLMRNGRPCEDCVSGSPYNAVMHGCYRNSPPASWAVARMVDTHRRRRTWEAKVDRLIALTEFAKSRFVNAGIPSDRIAVKPNFVVDRQVSETGVPRLGALFVGRLSPEKGLSTLLQAWISSDVPLRIVGDGPLLEWARTMALPDAEVLGRLGENAIVSEMGRAEFLVMPSEWYEGFPMVLAEAFCQGLPVITSRLGSMAEIVEDGVTGLHFTPGDAVDLAVKVRWAAEHPEEMRQMGLNARRVYEQKYTPETNYRQLIAIYEAAIEERSERSQA